MKTEEAIAKELKKERRKVFVRLYTLPWLISVALLIAIISFILLNKIHEELIETREFKPIIERKEFKREFPFKREYPLTVADYQLGKKIGINLEENVIEGVNWAIDKTYTSFLHNEHNEKTYTECAGMGDTNIMILKGVIKKAIRREFNGFETYHKLNN